MKESLELYKMPQDVIIRSSDHVTASQHHHTTTEQPYNEPFISFLIHIFIFLFIYMYFSLEKNKAQTY